MMTRYVLAVYALMLEKYRISTIILHGAVVIFSIVSLNVLEKVTL